LPGDLTYRIAPADFVTVEIFELLAQGQVWATTRRVNASGEFRLPAPVGDIRAAGLTVQELQDEITRIVDEKVMPDPMVNVTVDESAGFSYTVYGAVAGTGLYSLRSADFRLVDALSQAGGIPLATRKIYVIRQVPLTEEVIFQPGAKPARTPMQSPDRSPVDIEDLIRQLDDPNSRPNGRPNSRPIQPENDGRPRQDPPIDIEDLIEELDDDPPRHGVFPGAFAQERGPLIDIDDLEPVSVPPSSADAALVDSKPAPLAGHGDSFIYVQETDEWIPVKSSQTETAGPDGQPGGALFIERILGISYQRLKQGDSSYNIVIRPDDRIYVEEPQSGVVYVDGEIVRPGVYNFPASGKLTLSRLVAAAGGPGPLAIPTRVDLTRVVGENREATIRLNLAAIRNRTEPDIYLKPDDHIILGTNFWATPLAVFRNGLRITYGFGFLLDRNFGSDVFGAPPINRVN
jgi:polysaccharide export outer membrane protein